MNSSITVIGSGYVGLVSGACLSEFGLNVICMDIDEHKIADLQKGIIPIYEPGLEAMVTKNIAAGRLTFTTAYPEAVQNSLIIFIAVGTPPQEDGSADVQYVLSAARAIAENMNGYKLVVDKSTVPIGTGQRIKGVMQEILDQRGVDYEFDVVSNPEFLREGVAVADFMEPDRIVIGSENHRAEEIMCQVYSVLFANNHQFVFTNIETAELIKYASNAFLATKIAFINELTTLCEAIGADVEQLSEAMGLDHRIGKYYLRAGPGYGGSCFPKDTQALVSIARQINIDLSIVDAVIKANEAQKLRMADKIISAIGEVEGKLFAFLGLSFKPDTDDVRDSPAITVIRELIKRGARVKAYDPIAMKNARLYAFPDLDLQYCRNEYEAIQDCDAVVLITEWNQFKSLDVQRIKQGMKDDYFFDLRNIYNKDIMEENGFKYFGVGRHGGGLK